MAGLLEKFLEFFPILLVQQHTTPKLLRLQERRLKCRGQSIQVCHVFLMVFPTFLSCVGSLSCGVPNNKVSLLARVPKPEAFGQVQVLASPALLDMWTNLVLAVPCIRELQVCGDSNRIFHRNSDIGMAIL